MAWDIWNKNEGSEGKDRDGRGFFPNLFFPCEVAAKIVRRIAEAEGGEGEGGGSTGC